MTTLPRVPAANAASASDARVQGVGVLDPDSGHAVGLVAGGAGRGSPASGLPAMPVTVASTARQLVG